MSVVVYWRERLEERRPIRLAAYYQENYDWKPRLEDGGDTWPRLVAKQSIWKDYLAWHEDVYLKPYREAEYFKDFPDQLPQPANEVEFWHIMAPLLYVSGSRNSQTRGYFVWGYRVHMGERVQAKVHRAFVRLLEWEEHMAAFMLAVGGVADVTGHVNTVGLAMRRTRATTEANRNRLPKAMRKTLNS